MDLSQLELRFQLSDEQLGGLIGAGGNRDALRGLPLTLSWDVGSQILTYEAEIDRTAVAITENQGGIDIFARLKDINPGNVPPVGAFMAYSFPEPTVKGAFVVPAEAVSPSGEMFAVDDNNRITVFEVDVLRRVGEVTLVAGEAVRPGDAFVARRFIQLGEGTKVNPNRPEVPEQVADAPAPTGGIPDTGPVELDATQQDCMRSLIAGADGLPDRARERITAAIEGGTIRNPRACRSAWGWTSIPASTPVAAVAELIRAGSRPALAVDLTQTAILPDRAGRELRPARHAQGLHHSALERGSIQDPSRMAGLKERAGSIWTAARPPTRTRARSGRGGRG